MQAILKDHVIADSDDIVEKGGYHYFPSSATRLDLLVKARRPNTTWNARTASSSTT